MGTNQKFLLHILQCLCVLLPYISCFSQSQSKNGQLIKGKLQLDSIWEPVVYLSYIPTFKDMNTMSRDMIIAQAEIDSLGIFQFNFIEGLPPSDNLYRLHISKKNAPAASLIIGGREQNHMFFIANAKSSINIIDNDSIGLFNNYSISGYRPNQDLKEVANIIKKIESLDANTSSLKLDFISKNSYEKLRHIADTSSHHIVSLFALHNSDFEASFLSNHSFYDNYLEKWEENDSSYFKEFRSKLPKEETNNIIWYVLISIIFFAMGYLINYYYSFNKKQKINLLKSLSVQERKIFEMLQNGKSNKEISEELSIGISTVKSHVSNIYSKLDIKSRKEVLNI